MNEIDRKIQAALRRDASGNPPTDEPNLAEEMLAAFRGRHRWLSATMVVVNLAAFFGFVLAGLRFYEATEIAVQLRWGGVALALLAIVSSIKIWFWLELHTNRVLREVKRIELLLVSRRQE